MPRSRFAFIGGGALGRGLVVGGPEAVLFEELAHAASGGLEIGRAIEPAMPLPFRGEEFHLDALGRERIAEGDPLQVMWEQ